MRSPPLDFTYRQTGQGIVTSVGDLLKFCNLIQQGKLYDIYRRTYPNIEANPASEEAKQIFERLTPSLFGHVGFDAGYDVSLIVTSYDVESRQL